MAFEPQLAQQIKHESQARNIRQTQQEENMVSTTVILEQGTVVPFELRETRAVAVLGYEDQIS